MRRLTAVEAALAVGRQACEQGRAVPSDVAKMTGVLPAVMRADGGRGYPRPLGARYRAGGVMTTGEVGGDRPAVGNQVPVEVVPAVRRQAASKTALSHRRRAPGDGRAAVMPAAAPEGALSHNALYEELRVNYCLGASTS